MCRVRLHPFPGRARRARCLNPRTSSVGPPGRVATRAASTPDRVCAPRLARPQATMKLGIERGVILSSLESEPSSAGQPRCTPSFERGKRLLAPLGYWGFPGGQDGSREEEGPDGFLSRHSVRGSSRSAGAAAFRCPVTEPAAEAAGGDWEGRDGREILRSQRSWGCPRPGRGLRGLLGGGVVLRPPAAVAPRCEVRAVAPGVVVGRSPPPLRWLGDVFALALGFVESLGGVLVVRVPFHPPSVPFFWFFFKREKKKIKPLVLGTL